MASRARDCRIFLALQHSNKAACKAQPLSHHSDHIGEQGLNQVRFLNFHTLIVLLGEFIDHARDLCFDRSAARASSDKSHFANRRMLAEATHPHRPSIPKVNDNTNTAFENKMHRIGRLTLAGNASAWTIIEAPASLRESVSVLQATERFSQPLAQ